LGQWHKGNKYRRCGLRCSRGFLADCPLLLSCLTADLRGVKSMANVSLHLTLTHCGSAVTSEALLAVPSKWQVLNLIHTIIALCLAFLLQRFEKPDRSSDVIEYQKAFVVIQNRVVVRQTLCIPDRVE